MVYDELGFDGLTKHPKGYPHLYIYIYTPYWLSLIGCRPRGLGGGRPPRGHRRRQRRRGARGGASPLPRKVILDK